MIGDVFKYSRVMELEKEGTIDHGRRGRKERTEMDTHLEMTEFIMQKRFPEKDNRPEGHSFN